jgi:hypothetical protein
MVERGVPYDIAQGLVKNTPDAMTKYAEFIQKQNDIARAKDILSSLPKEVEIPMLGADGKPQIGPDGKIVTQRVPGISMALRDPKLKSALLKAYPELADAAVAPAPAPVTSGNPLQDIYNEQNAQKFADAAKAQQVRTGQNLLSSINLPPADPTYRTDLMNVVRGPLETGDMAKLQEIRQQLILGASNPQSGITPAQLAAIKEVLEYIRNYYNLKSQIGTGGQMAGAM